MKILYETNIDGGKWPKSWSVDRYCSGFRHGTKMPVWAAGVWFRFSQIHTKQYDLGIILLTDMQTVQVKLTSRNASKLLDDIWTFLHVIYGQLCCLLLWKLKSTRYRNYATVQRTVLQSRYSSFTNRKRLARKLLQCLAPTKQDLSMKSIFHARAPIVCR